MKILFAINRDIIQDNIIKILSAENRSFDYVPERDSVFSKDLIVEKVKYNMNSQEAKYDIAIINEKLDGEYDLIEIVRFLTRNKVRPILLLSNKSDNDPLIHALIKRKVYDFLYGTLKFEDIYRCIINPRRYEDIEHLVDIDAEEYNIQGKSISDMPFEMEHHNSNAIEPNNIMHGPKVQLPGIDTPAQPKGPSIKMPNLPKINDIKGAIKSGAGNITSNVQNKAPMNPNDVVIQQQYIPQVPLDYKKNIAIYSNQQVGKSFVACNMATMFAAKGKRTVLVDLDFRNKSQYYYFDMSKFESRAQSAGDMNIIAKVFEADTEDPNELLNELFSPMKNLYVVTAHPDIVIKDYTTDDLFRVFSMLKSMFDIVIYDIPGYCEEEYLRLIMTQVEDIMVITNQNCAILDRTEKDLRDVLTGYFVNNKVSLIINQYVEHKDMTKGSIAEHLSVIETSSKNIEFNFRNVFVIPDKYYELIEGIAKGKPAVTFDEQLKYIFNEITNKYYPEVAPRRRG